MTVIDDQISLGDLVTTVPQLARELENLGLDYCCHGQRSLAVAAEEAGLDVTEVIAKLSAVPTSTEAPQWADMGPAELSEHVQSTHHKYMWDEMPRLSLLIDKIVDVHGANHPELKQVQDIYAQLRVEIEPHLRREELMVFPSMRRLAAGQQVTVTAATAGGDTTIAGRIAVLVSEHDQAGQLLDRLREVTDDYRTPDDGCNTYRATYQGLDEFDRDLHLHVHKENNILFPEVIRLEQAQLGLPV